MATACCCSDGVDGYEWDWFESVPMYVDVLGGCGGSRLFSYVESKVESGGVSFSQQSPLDGRIC